MAISLYLFDCFPVHLFYSFAPARHFHYLLLSQPQVMLCRAYMPMDTNRLPVKRTLLSTNTARVLNMPYPDTYSHFFVYLSIFCMKFAWLQNPLGLLGPQLSFALTAQNPRKVVDSRSRKNVKSEPASQTKGRIIFTEIQESLVFLHSCSLCIDQHRLGSRMVKGYPGEG